MRLGSAEGRLELLVIQPTPFCNLNCDYCYLPDRASTVRISEAVLERTFERVMASRHVQDSFTVVWHAGEPLVMPISFYEEAFRTIQEVNHRGIRIDHSFQTNGTLLNADWCDFLDRHAVRVGVSVDGPAFLHDARRKTRSGRGTHDRVMRGIRCLQERGIDFHVITVLTRAALEHPDALFDFYVESGIRRVGFNVEEIEGTNTTSTMALENVEDELRRFLTRFLERMDRSTAPLEVRELHGLQRFIASGQAPLERNQENTPMRILSVDWQGNVTTLSPELLGLRDAAYGSFVLGNVLRDEIDAIEAGPQFRRMVEDVEEGVALCRRTCPYFGVCGGGSPSNKISENGSFRSAETLHCRLTRKVVVDVVLDHLEGRRARVGCLDAPRRGAYLE
jgi:uncharacterized protein